MNFSDISKKEKEMELIDLIKFGCNADERNKFFGKRWTQHEIQRGDMDKMAEFVDRPMKEIALAEFKV